ncbi:dehydrogenase [Novosphingobium marinum]|uniref:Threonine dehydrogenase-like Zn-dependent dehydrogenase n=1 Tax=Novosphingobium marinum TaxID=1514948 RepID=A0A7Y9Y0J9_9SPHN|nr:zinc-binding dehydrogenase [Novosphingobium marinum]NYH96758.1 threonine dehydrogenase-like Zn-dependent dehydrogenase [Novosphingobium marinum]GGC40455.1 dehydrogenase [Novosphingobium marinum]
MKAWITHGYGDMRLEERDPPDPKPGWVKVKVLVAQPSITEILLFEGERTYGHEIIARRLREGPGALFGHEFSAQVVALGEGVTTLKAGDRVAARGSHPEGIVGFDYPGAFAEFGVFPESLLAPLPPSVSDSAGAAIQALTDCVAAAHAAAPRLDETAVVIGLGAMGFGCLQAARAAGAGRVVAVGRRREALDLALALGADDVVDASSEDPVEAVRKLTGGNGADVVFECAGGPVSRGLAGNTTMIQAARMARDEARVIGLAFDGDAAVLPYADFRFRSIRFAFPSVLTRALFERTVALASDGRVRVDPLIGCTLDGLERLPEAFDLTLNKSRHGLINPAQIRISQATETT